MATTIEELKILINTEIKNINDIQRYADGLRKAFEGIKLNPKLESSFKDIFTSLTKSIEDASKQFDNGIFDDKGLKNFRSRMNDIVSLFNQLRTNTGKIKPEQWATIIDIDPAKIKEYTDAIEDAKQKQANFKTESKELEAAIKAIAIAEKEVKDAGKDPDKFATFKNLKNIIETLDFSKLGSVINALKKIGPVSDEVKDDIEKNLSSVRTQYQNLDDTIKENQKNIVAAKLDDEDLAHTVGVDLDESLRHATGSVQNLNATISETSTSAINASKGVETLLNRLTYFLSIGNAIRLLTRTIRSSFDTIKELDAAMTETATVTEYSVGQMWSKLDEYTSIANQLGASTLGTYKTITMFFQQGLNERQSLELATETMKMARVANIDYAQATEYMTAALRGFNLELNNTEATRVNDVYSELAKITAADTQQIAIAMSKVASLANSANMELETTSAFLSQIIETTQEAPETAGTALKTIIARFSEVKKLYSEGELTGTDEEGETIDVNKIGTALRTAGIDLNKFITGQAGLDEIFIELAKKWDSLDLVTQRYIATMAAGSRQQSRFIAMMQDYDRTIELVNAAYASAGSGQEQFDKTLESIEAKLNKLKNSWDSFTMSIANSDVVKAGVDTLNLLLTTINKITDAFGSASGAIKVFLAAGIGKMAGTVLRPALSAMATDFQRGGNLNTAFGAARGTMSQSFANVAANLKGLINPQIAAQNELNNLLSQRRALLDQNGEVIQGAQKQYDDLTIRIAETTKRTKGLILETANLGRNLQAIGLAANVAGTLLKKFGESLPEGKLKDFTNTASNIVNTLGTTALGVGTLMRIFPEMASTVIASIKAMDAATKTTILVAIIAVIAAIDYFVQRAQKAKQASEDYYDTNKKITQSLTDIANAIEDLQSGADTLLDLKKGTLAWTLQVEKLRKQYDELIELYPELEKLGIIKFDPETGYFSFDEKKFTEYQSQESKARDRADRVSKLHAGNMDLYNKVNTYDRTKALDGSAKNTLDSDVLAELYPWLTQENSDAIMDRLATESRSLGGGIFMNKKKVIEKMTAITGKESEEWATMTKEQLREAYMELLLDSFAYDYQPESEENLKESLRDKTGQNIYDAYGGTDELGERLDLKLSENESATALQGYWSTLKDLPDSLKENADALKALALETADALKNYEDLNKVLKDNKDILKSNAKDTEAYGVAVGRVWAAVKNSVGSGISYDFVEQHIDDFMEAFEEGSEEALFRIQDALIETFDINEFLKDKGIDKDGNVIPITLDETQIQNIRDTLTELTQDREFRLNGTGDFTALWDLLTKTYGLSKEVANAMIQQFMIEGVFVDDGNGNFHYNVSNAGLQNVRNLSAGGSSKKGGGSSKKDKAWENPYDQLYNLTERNEEAIRRRNILEKEYNALLRDRTNTSNALVKNSLKELANLQEQLSYQRQLKAGREKQLNAVSGEMYTDSEGNRKSYADWGVTQYAHYNRETNAIEIDWDAIDKITDETKGKAIEDYIKRLEELQKQFEQVDSDILDIEAEIDEINSRSMDEYLSFEQRVYDAIVQQHQDVIDQYSSFNDTLNETNSKIIDSLREQIDLERQIRDNTKTEEDIAAKESRLAYLQRDTSGANATETLRLQKEIDDARQAYSDSLIDQQIDAIEKGNEQAAEQRQIQIKTMQEQLNYWRDHGAFWDQTHTLIQSAFDEEGNFLPNSQLVTLLQGTEEFSSLSKFGQTDWYNDLAEAFMKAQEGFSEWKMEEARKEGKIEQDGNTYTYDKDKKSWMLDGEAYSAVYDPVSGKYIFTRNRDEDVPTGDIGQPGTPAEAPGDSERNSPSYTPPPEDKPTLQSYKVDYNNGSWVKTVKAASEEAAVATAAEIYKREKGFGSNFPYTTWKNKTKVNLVVGSNIRYASGGFADFTGPAWLDGTKSKPEAVLSAKQTELFISLRDMLEKFGQTGGFNNAMGNTYVDLDVNADIGSDYDVDSLVARLKRDILESSNYRNVNMLSRGH